jgi:hypothetical protein
MSRLLFGASVVLVAAGSRAHAQRVSDVRPATSKPSFGQTISVSPLFALLGFYTADVERRVISMATLGVGGSAFSLGPFGYKSVDLKARYYPGGRALEGTGLGVSAGMIRLSADEGGIFSSPASGSGIVVGTDVTHTKIHGNLVLSVGGGVKHILRYGGYDVSRIHLTYPTARASVGVAF